jgi:hypothetical protein
MFGSGDPASSLLVNLFLSQLQARYARNRLACGKSLSPPASPFAPLGAALVTLQLRCSSALFGAALLNVATVQTLHPSLRWMHTEYLHPVFSVVPAYSQYGETHPLARTSSTGILPLRKGLNPNQECWWVQARLCSHLSEMTGLTTRAHGTARTVCSFHILPSRWWTLYLLPHQRLPGPARFLYRPRPQCRSGNAEDGIRRRLVNA